MAKKAKRTVKPGRLRQRETGSAPEADRPETQRSGLAPCGRAIGQRTFAGSRLRQRENGGACRNPGRQQQEVFRRGTVHRREFARKYGERDLRALQGLTFAHVCRLIVVEDDERRDWYRQQCQERGWSCRQLSTKIYEEFGKRSKGGKPLEKVKKVGPKAALRKVLWLRDVALKQCVPMLEQNQARLAMRMSRQPDDELVALVSETCTALDELHVAVKDARITLRLAKSATKVRSG